MFHGLLGFGLILAVKTLSNLAILSFFKGALKLLSASNTDAYSYSKIEKYVLVHE
jgi:hypothetical protein